MSVGRYPQADRQHSPTLSNGRWGESAERAANLSGEVGEWGRSAPSGGGGGGGAAPPPPRRRFGTAATTTATKARKVPATTVKVTGLSAAGARRSMARLAMSWPAIVPRPRTKTLTTRTTAA